MGCLHNYHSPRKVDKYHVRTAGNSRGSQAQQDRVGQDIAQVAASQGPKA